MDNQLDLQLLALLNFIAEPIAGDITPATAQVGRLYLNTSTGALMFCNSSSTVIKLLRSGEVVDADIAGGAAIANSKLATNPLARSNHTGTQLAATISDFATAVLAFRLDQFAQPTANIPMNSHKFTGLTAGSGAGDSVEFAQMNNAIDARVNGQDWKSSVRVASTANGTLASAFANGQVVDGVTLVTGDRILLKNQTTAADNGIYTVNAAGAPTRATDADSSAEVTAGMTVPVSEGTTQLDTIWLLTTNDAITLGTTALAFTQIGAAGSTYTAGAGLALAGNQFAIENSGVLTVAHGGTGAATAGAARTALGVPRAGFAADVGAITAGGTVDVTHSLGTEDVHVQIYKKSDGSVRYLSVVHKGADPTNVITLGSNVAWTSGQLRVVVLPVS